MMRNESHKTGWQTWIRYSLLIALVSAAVFLWWTDGRESPVQTVQPTVTPATQTDHRLQRETAYDRDVSALQALLESGAADEATQEIAAQKLTALVAEHQNEIGLEEALREAGYDNAVVIVQNGAVTVMIPQELLTEASSAQILTLCVAHAGVGAENIRIMALK